MRIQMIPRNNYNDKFKLPIELNSSHRLELGLLRPVH